MGEIGGGTMTIKKKKKKGRPSLLDLQKRSLKQQQQQKNPNSIKNPNSPRSARRNPNSTSNLSYSDDDDERTQKKHKLLLGFNNNSQIALKRRHTTTSGSHLLGEEDLKGTVTPQESPVEPGPTTPLPDKKLLDFILDRLQKKDTYGVFSEPADSEELPDYHEIIEHPMDFSTIRKKLDGGAYASLEQFEKDVFLICSNAMQYNPPDTVYYRQARAMQELAKKDFENLRQDSDDGDDDDDEPQTPPPPKVVRRGRPPGKQKKSLEKSPLDRIAPECSPDATLASGGDATNLSTGYNLRRTFSYKYQPSEVLVRNSHGSHSSETYTYWTSEWENEFPASVVRAVHKYGQKAFQVDENKRDSYYQPPVSTNEQSSLNVFEAELKQLMPVGLNSEHGYARSLARFAANMGPIVWKIASKKIGSVLPPGLEFGPGWVGEDKVIDGQQQGSFSDRQKVSNNLISNDISNVPQSTATGRDFSTSSRSLAWSRQDMVENDGGVSSRSDLPPLNNVSGINHASSVPVQQKPIIHSDTNDLSNSFGYNNVSSLTGTGRFGIPTGKLDPEHTAFPSQAFGMASTSSNTLSLTLENDCNSNKSKLAGTSNGIIHSGSSSAMCSSVDSETVLNAGFSGKSWQGLSAYHQQELHQFPQDLNVGFLAPNSPGGSVPIRSPQQPDLALQL